MTDLTHPPTDTLEPRDVLSRPLIAALRRWDYAAAQRVHHLIAISSEIQERIRRFYGRESRIIYPPVDTQKFFPAKKGIKEKNISFLFLDSSLTKKSTWPSAPLIL